MAAELQGWARLSPDDQAFLRTARARASSDRHKGACASCLYRTGTSRPHTADQPEDGRQRGLRMTTTPLLRPWRACPRWTESTLRRRSPAMTWNGRVCVSSVTQRWSISAWWRVCSRWPWPPTSSTTRWSLCSSPTAPTSTPPPGTHVPRLCHHPGTRSDWPAGRRRCMCLGATRPHCIWHAVSATQPWSASFLMPGPTVLCATSST
jgi:hypothetical protein